MLAPYGMIPMVMNQAEDSRCGEVYFGNPMWISYDSVPGVNPTEEKKEAECIRVSNRGHIKLTFDDYPR